MNPHDIADILGEIATLLELKGENPFKVRAYRTGARAIEAMEEDELDRRIGEEGLESLPGVGEALTKKIAELRSTGRLAFHEELKASIAPGLIEMLQIPGLGPKKILALHKRLGVAGVAALAKACADGRVAELDGFGEKSQANILTGIANREAWGRRHLWWEAWRVAEPIVAGLRALPAVRRAEAAGSLRRGLETVGDLDFIVAADEIAPVAAWFTQLPSVREVTARGETKVSVRLEDGLQADLRIVPEAQFVFALHHFTGSKDHNVQMRQRALARGLSLGEWGLTPVPGGKASPVATPADEAGLFGLLGLRFIPPELREGLGEIEAAERGELPRLIELADLRGALHNHTTASDGHSSLAAMAEAAQALGWDYLGIADHSKSSWQAHGLDEERLLAQVEEIRKLNASGRFRTHLFAGTECDILPDGRLDFDDATLGRLDYVVASVHSAMTQDEETMTARLIRAIEHPKVTVLGHPTGRLLLRREPSRVNLGKVIDAAIACRTPIELNANPWRLDLDWRQWRRAAERGLVCCINPDAHETGDLGYLRAGIAIARKGWLTPGQVLNTRDREGMRRWFQHRK